MTLSNEELDKARTMEAERRIKTGSWWDVATEAARLAREGWLPKHAVDPLILTARKICAFFDSSPYAVRYTDGDYDKSPTMSNVLKILREQEQDTSIINQPEPIPLVKGSQL